MQQDHLVCNLCRPQCTDIQVCLESNQLYTLNDALQSGGPRSLLQQIDLETRTPLASVHELSEQHDLVCFAPDHGSLGGDWGNELYAGAMLRSKLHAPLTLIIEAKLRWFAAHHVAAASELCPCRLLHFLYLENAVPLLPQGQVCHICAVCVRPARSAEPGKSCPPCCNPEQSHIPVGIECSNILLGIPMLHA